MADPWVMNDTKITNYGDNYLDMKAPSATTPVHGTNEPVTPTAITTLNDSAEMFALIGNNIEFINNKTLSSNLTMTIANTAELDAVNAFVAGLYSIDYGVTLTIDVTANVTGTTANFPLSFTGIGGSGTIEIDGSSTYSLGTSDAAKILNFYDCSCNINIKDVGFDNTTGNAPEMVDIEKCSKVTTSGIVLAPHATSTGIVLNLTECSATIGATFNNGGLICLSSARSKVLISSLTSFGIPTSSVLSLAQTDIHFYNLDYSKLPMGAGATAITTPVNSDASSVLTATEYTSLAGSVHTVTFADTGATDVIPDVMRYMDFVLAGRSNLDVNLKLKLPGPAAALTDASDTFKFIDIDGKGSLLIEGDTFTTGLSTSQNTKIESSNAPALYIYNCSIPIWVHGIKFDSTSAVDASIKIEKSTNVVTRYNYLIADNTTESGVEMIQSTTIHEDETCGVCKYGILSSYSSHVYVNGCYGIAADIVGYGVLAVDGGYLGTNYISAADRLTGTLGTANSASGGTVKEN